MNVENSAGREKGCLEVRIDKLLLLKIESSILS